MAEQLLSIRDVADQLKVSELTIRRLIKNGEITVGRVGGQWRFKQSDVDEYIEKNRGETFDAIEG